MTDPIRLSKRLIEEIGCSRREAELYIEGGWVTVDGVVVEEPQFKVAEQRVELLPNAVLTPVEPVTLLLNVPNGHSPDRAVESISPASHWPEDGSGIRPLKSHFARLTSCIPLQAGADGLHVLTQDWRIERKLKEDLSKLEQEYVVEVVGTLSASQLKQLAHGLTFNGGRLTQVSQRNSSNREDMTVMKGPRRNIVTGVNPTTDQFDFIGGDYKWSNGLTTGYHYAHLEDLYKQHFLTLSHTLPVTEGQSLKSDLRWSSATDDGNSNVDNRMLGAMFTYALGAHAFGLSYQKMSGDTGFANVNGADPYLVNLVQINDFANQDERSFQARYDFNFAGVGIPGLTFMTRYVKGDQVNLGAAPGDGKEWERNTDIGYVIQSGALKNVGIKWRNASYRSSFASDIDDYVGWTLARLARSPDFDWTDARADDWRQPYPGWIRTRYEAKAVAAGRV